MNHSKPDINPAHFSALRAFLHGYFHEDVADEYGTPVDAAEQFCEDADSNERVAVAQEWMQLMELLRGQALPEINQTLARKFGGAVRLKEEELRQVSEIFARCLAVKTHRKAVNH